MDLWRVDPAVDYILEIDDLGPEDTVRYRFTPLLLADRTRE